MAERVLPEGPSRCGDDAHNLPGTHPHPEKTLWVLGWMHGAQMWGPSKEAAGQASGALGRGKAPVARAEAGALPGDGAALGRDPHPPPKDQGAQKLLKKGIN